MILTCVGNVTEAKYAFLKDEDLNWFCALCRGPAVQAAQTDKLIEDRRKRYMVKAMEEIKTI